jgi:hypothetical protein
MFIATLFTLAKLWIQPKMPYHWWVDLKMCYIYNIVILFSHKEEWNFVVCRKWIEPRTSC